MASLSLAQILADFHEIGQLQIFSFKSKRWVKALDGIVTIEYVSNLKQAHNVLLKIQAIHIDPTKVSSYSYRITPPFQIHQKEHNGRFQNMVKARNLASDTVELLAIVFKKKAVANKFYNLIVTLSIFIHSLCPCTCASACTYIQC